MTDKQFTDKLNAIFDKGQKAIAAAEAVPQPDDAGLADVKGAIAHKIQQETSKATSELCEAYISAKTADDESES